MYYRTANEIRETYANAGLKELFYRETTLGKRLHHEGHFFIMQKKVKTLKK